MNTAILLSVYMICECFCPTFGEGMHYGAKSAIRLVVGVFFILDCCSYFEWNKKW